MTKLARGSGKHSKTEELFLCILICIGDKNMSERNFMIRNGVLERYIEEKGVTEAIIPEGVTTIGCLRQRSRCSR